MTSSSAIIKIMGNNSSKASFRNAQSSQKYIRADWKAGFQSGIFDMYKEGMLTDVTLVIEGRKFPCHKLVLCAASEYFRCMFTSPFKEAGKDEIEICDISASAFGSVLEYVYGGQVVITADNVEELLNIACMMHFSELKSSCCKLYRCELSLSNVMEIIQIAERYSADELSETCADLIVKNYGKLKSVFNKLPLETACAVLKRNHLPVLNEKETASAVIQWLKANDGGAAAVEKLMTSVRLTELEPFYVKFTLLQSKEVHKSDKVVEMLEKYCSSAQYGLSLPREIAIKHPRPSTGVNVQVR